jgi:hypothetical protein
MIICYFMISVFVAGMFTGSMVESKTKPEFPGFVILFLLAIFWPFMVYVSIKEYFGGKS